MSQLRALALFLFCFVSLWASGQQNCPLPPTLLSAPTAENIFSDQQEVDLGDAMAETIALHVNIIKDDELGAHLRELGSKLVQYLPPTKLNFRFYLIDIPDVNAFSIAGGRVYISRKVVAFAKNDDEVAGILAHELGHIVTHQAAIEMTRSFRETLGVTKVGDRDDVFKKFHQLVENARRNRHSHSEGERHQLVADQVEVFTLARAGFNPQAAAEIWDRFNELHGKTGTWLSDLFGNTTAAQHRLRDMVKNMAALPPGCSERPAENESTFTSWQEAVVEYDNAARSEVLPGLISKHRLGTRLRPEITNLRFSPDGRYILAQDDGGINVVSRTPFAFLFYIPATDANDAQFSPDSKFVVFFTNGLRSEIWNIDTQKRKSVHEITLREPCLQSELSPEGTVLACLRSDHGLELIDVSNSSVIYRRKDFFIPSFFEAFNLLFSILRSEADDSQDLTSSVHLINMAFTPDGHYFLGAHGFPASVLMYDLNARHEMSAPGSIKDLSSFSFTFVGADKFVGINPRAPQKSRVLRFPSGEVISEIQLWSGMRLRGAAHGDAVLIGPLKDYPLGVVDLNTKDNRLVIRQPTADVYDNILLTERLNGELGLHTREKGDTVGLLNLPESDLGRLRVSASSRDLKYLSISTRSRGAVWDLERDSRLLYTRKFSAAGFDGSLMYADFPKFEETPRSIGVLDLKSGGIQGHDLKDDVAVQHGSYLLVTKPRNKNGTSWSNADVEVREVRSGNVLWSRYFPDEMPAITFDTDEAIMTLKWNFDARAAHSELQKIPQLKQRAEKEDYLCEFLDAKTGTVLSGLVVKTNKGSLRHVRVSANQKWAVAEAAGDQIITYAVPSGEEGGHFFGTRPILSTTGLLAVQSEKREVTLYDLTTFEMRQHYNFAKPIACKAFSEDGKRLLVFTNDQTVYLFDTTRPSQPEPAVASNP